MEQKEKSNPDLLSQLLPDALEDALGLGGAGAGGADQQRLRALAGASGGPLQAAVQEFLEGKGELYASAQATRGGGLAESTLETLLVDKFHLSPVLAKLIAGLLISVFPDSNKTAKKPRRKKPKTSTRPKSEAKTGRKESGRKDSTGKKPKKKATTKPKKPASTTAKKKTRTNADLSS